MVRPKRFDVKLAVVGLLFLVVGLLVYLLIYATMPEPKILLSVDESGRALAVAANHSPGSADARHAQGNGGQEAAGSA